MRKMTNLMPAYSVALTEVVISYSKYHGYAQHRCLGFPGVHKQLPICIY